MNENVDDTAHHLQQQKQRRYGKLRRIARKKCPANHDTLVSTFVVSEGLSETAAETAIDHFVAANILQHDNGKLTLTETEQDQVDENA